MTDEIRISMEPDYHKWYTEIPNMVDDMGLSVYAYRLYGRLRRVAGENGSCWQSTATLAEACGMSAGKVSAAKKELAKKGLIIINVVPQKHGEFPAHDIVITNIWAANYQKYSTRSPHERTRSLSEQERSPHETKNNPIKNNPIDVVDDTTPQHPEPTPEPTQPERPNIYRQYEAALGIMITPMISETLKEAEQQYPAEWLEEAFKVAAANNGRSWAYVKAILDKWQQHGFKADTRTPKPQTPSKSRRKSQAELLAELAAL